MGGHIDKEVLGQASLPDGARVNMVGTTFNRWVDDFGGTSLDLDKWDVVEVVPGITHTVNSSSLVVSMGVTASAERHYISKGVFTIPFDIYVGLKLSQRIIGNNVWIEAIEVDRDGKPVAHSSIAGEIRNRAGLAYLSNATAGAANLEATCGDSPNGSQTASTTGWATTTNDHDIHLEYRIADTWASNVAMDSVASRSSTGLRNSRQVPDANKLYKLRVRFRNEAVAPVSNTDVTLYRVALADVQELLVEMASGRGDNAAGRAISANVTTIPGVQGSVGDNSSTVPNPQLVSILMNSTAGGPTAGTAARQGSIQGDLARRAVVRPLGVPQSHDSNRVTVTATSETTLIAAVASIRHELHTVTFANRDNVAHTLDLRDALAGTVRETVIVGAGATLQLDFPAGRPAAAANAAWTVQMRETATTAVEVSVSSYRTTA